MNDKTIIRRSISIPKDLDTKIEILKNRYSFNVKNELIIELLELGILKYQEDLELKTKLNRLLDNIEVIYDKLGIE